jgi:hypothetical protein
MANEKNVAVENKTDPGLVDKIIKQIEYYFGDINMSKDKFMQEEIQKESGCKLNYIVFYSSLLIFEFLFFVKFISIRGQSRNFNQIQSS